MGPLQRSKSTGKRSTPANTAVQDAILMRKTDLAWFLQANTAKHAVSVALVRKVRHG